MYSHYRQTRLTTRPCIIPRLVFFCFVVSFLCHIQLPAADFTSGATLSIARYYSLIRYLPCIVISDELLGCCIGMCSITRATLSTCRSLRILAPISRSSSHVRSFRCVCVCARARAAACAYVHLSCVCCVCVCVCLCLNTHTEEEGGAKKAQQHNASYTSSCKPHTLVP